MKFEMWGWFHFVMILAPFILLVLLIFITRKSNYKTKWWIGLSLSIAAVLLLIARNIEILINNGFAFDPELIPLQICHFANFVLLFAYLLKNKTLFAFSFTINFPAAFLALIFAGGLENYTTLASARAIAYIAGHGLLVLIPLFALFSGEININLKRLLFTSILMLSLYIISNPINNIINLLNPNDAQIANYFYTVKAENGPPLTNFWNMGTDYVPGGWYHINPIYILMSILLGVVVLFAFFGLYKLLVHVFKIKVVSNITTK